MLKQLLNMAMAAITMVSFKWIAGGNIELLILMVGYFVITYLMNIMDAIGDINQDGSNNSN